MYYSLTEQSYLTTTAIYKSATHVSTITTPEFHIHRESHYGAWCVHTSMSLFSGSYYVHYKNVVYYMALWSANHTVIRVVNTTQCHMIHQLVWYAHFIFYSVELSGHCTSLPDPIM